MRPRPFPMQGVHRMRWPRRLRKPRTALLAAAAVLLAVAFALPAPAEPRAAQRPGPSGAAGNASPAPSPEASVVRVFTLQHRRADEAAAILRPLLTDAGSVLLQPKLNTITVRDRARAVENAARAIAAFDQPPRALSIAVTLLKATTEGTGREAPPRPVSEEIRGVGERLKRLFNLTSYAPLDTVVVQGIEGNSVAYVVGREFRLEFLLEPGTDDSIVRLKNLALSRQRTEGGREVSRDLLRTTINIPLHQPYVLGIGKDESASGALFLVFVASPREPGPGILGVR